MPSQHDFSVEAALGDRQVLPRWRSPAESMEEFAGGVQRPFDERGSSKWLTKLRLELQERPTELAARELRETAFVLGVDLGDEEARLDALIPARLTPALNGPVLTRDLPRMDAGSCIADLRRKVAMHSKQPLAWTELSRLYLSTGQPEKAERAMACALSLAPNSKFVLRAAVRLYSHWKNYDQALWLLKKNPRTTLDPWLMAAEVATAALADGVSKRMPIALRMLEKGGESPRRFAELAAAVGTVEHHSGRHKQAKRLIAQSLEDPTENALAQALWVSQQDEKIRIPESALLTPDSFEARARTAYANGDWNSTYAQAYRWLLDEPFDPRAAVLGSVIGFEPELTESAIQIATFGLKAGRDTPALLNNRAVSLAYSGRIAEAFADVQHALKHIRNDAHLLATLGLIGFRAGWTDFGANAYSQAVGWFAEQREPASVIRAALYWLREEVHVGISDGRRELLEIKAAISKLPLRDQESDLFGLIRIIEREDQDQPKRSTATSYFFAEEDLKELAERMDVPLGARRLSERSEEAERASTAKLGRLLTPPQRI